MRDSSARPSPHTGNATLVVDFVPGTTLLREQDRPSQLPILGNGPPGTFVLFPFGLKVSLPTDQIVFSDAAGGSARVGFGGMRFVGLVNGQLEFTRAREILPEAQLSPARSHIMRLDPAWVTAMWADDVQVWPAVPRA